MKRFNIFFFTILFCVLLWLHYGKAAAFSDVSTGHPNYQAIIYLQENGIVEGYEDDTFKPERMVNRAEALKIILLGSDIIVPNIQAQEIFPDVTHDAWYGKYTAKAKNLGIVKGDDDTGFFRPGDTVNLAEALKILLAANNAKSATPKGNPYADVPTDAWFAPYFEYARLTGLLDQSQDEDVHPATPVSRGLLAELMYRLATNEVILPDGKASYYGEKFHGKTTANGEVFDASAFTAAHRTYPFDTWLKVTNAANGASVLVRVNDRGPYAGEDRIIDLSKAAFEAISPLSRGIIEVKLEEAHAPAQDEVLPEEEAAEETLPTITASDLNSSPRNCPGADNAGYISRSIFEGILADNDIPDVFLEDEALTITGSISANTDTVSAFIIDSNEEQTAFYAPVSSGRFAINISFPKPGDFKLGVLPGASGSSIIQNIKVLENDCFNETENSSLSKISGLDPDIVDGDIEIEWNKGDYDLFKLTFIQGTQKKSYIMHDTDVWIPDYGDFSFFKEKNTELIIRGADDPGGALAASQIKWSPPSTFEFNASTHHEYEVNDSEARLLTLTKIAEAGTSIKTSFKPKVPVRSKAAIILPDGKVKEISLSSDTISPVDNQFGIEVFPSGDEIIQASYKVETAGIHFLEINNAEGLAVINVPVYEKGQYPLLPSIRDLSSQTVTELSGTLSQQRNEMLGLINENREKHGFVAIDLDNSLNSLAQFRSDDMLGNNYFGHWDKDGRSANDLRMNYGIQTLVGENLAKDVNIELAQYGLMRSAIHRSNILSKEWTRVGIGITKDKDGGYIFVQIFSGDPLDMDDLSALRESVLDKINENRTATIIVNSQLNSLAQTWSDRMADDDFFDFTAPNGDTLVDSVRADGINKSLGTYIMGNSSFSDALLQLDSNAQLKESKWTEIGIGIRQDNSGIIKITLIYTE